MIRNAGGYVTFYGDEGSEVDADEVVTVLSEKDRLRHYGDYDWHKDFFKHSADSEGQKKFDAATISAINMRKTKDDILLCPLGNYHKRVVDNVGLMSVESGIGYTGVYGKFLVFESDVWRHYVYGMMKSARGKAYDTVIPNVYDVSEFPFVDKKEDYYLYVGRLITSKGINVAAETVERVGGKLIVAGQGNLKDLGLANLKHVEHIGVADRTTVAELMGKARAVFVPTLYIEPFGGVAVEAQMCGTPVITSDWGAFVETVNHGVTGYRCNTLKDFVTAAENVSNIDCKACRAWATSRYSLDVGTRLYSNYFLRLKTLLYGGKGWYELT
jgi:glycosyltransferase involved in cell wall biosynthesis